MQDVCQSCPSPNGCNSKEVQSCYKCNSDDDENCATWHHDEMLEFEICPESCLTKVTEYGKTIRACKSDNFKCEVDDQFCTPCYGLACNEGIYPEDRLQCYQCNETDDSCDEAQRGKTYACSVYDPDDKCYQFINEKGKIVRGCKSDQNYQECLKKGPQCLVCSGSGCNSYAKEKANTLPCMQCDDSEECPWAQLTSKSCASYIPFFATPSCFTHLGQNNFVIRGCTGDPDECDPTSDKNCDVCTYPSCNKGNAIYQNCVQCTAEIGGGPCAESAQGIDTTRCANDIQFYDKRGCYVMRDGNTIKRGCVNALDEVSLNKCKKSDEACEICLTQGCNYQEVPSSAKRFLVSLPVLLGVIVKYLI